MNNEPENIITIMIVDDHPIVADGITQLINREPDMNVCAAVEDAESALKGIEKYSPQLMIVDISLKGSANGIDLIKGIKKRYPGIKTLVLSMHDENLYAERAIKAGARGYVMKNDLTDNIIKAIRKIMGDHLYLSENITSRLLKVLVNDELHHEKRDISKLSDREFQIFQFIARGYKTGDIAREINISVKTVEAHKLRIRHKLDLKSSPELVKFAFEWDHKSDN